MRNQCGVDEFGQWDQSTARVPWYKSIDLTFIRNMPGDLCAAQYRDGWDNLHICMRLPGHTGRHFDTNFTCIYPTAVWR
jgi:hypothetical protein